MMRTFASSASLSADSFAAIRAPESLATLSDVPAPEVIREWELGPAEIRSAANAAAAGPDAVLSACRRMFHQETGDVVPDLAQMPIRIGDIIFTADVRKQLQEHSHRPGCASRCSNTGALSVFPDGSRPHRVVCRSQRFGKTMAAQVLARELNRELLRVDIPESSTNTLARRRSACNWSLSRVSGRLSFCSSTRPTHCLASARRSKMRWIATPTFDRLSAATHGAVRGDRHSRDESQERSR